MWRRGTESEARDHGESIGIRRVQGGGRVLYRRECLCPPDATYVEWRFHGGFGDADWVLSLLTGRESDFGPASAWSARLRGQRLCSEMLS
ncbi:putative transporter MCH2 [Fusarium oxysporum f. sp. albedinis]|nr:putative transporter MCH2 [Fusarium oxysporum f. sp. albedinis]